MAPTGRAPRLLEVDGQALRDSSGALLGAVVAMTDITESRRVARELEDRELLFRRAFLDSPTPVAYLETSGRVREVNAALRRLLSASTRELVGSPLALRVHPQDRPALDVALSGGGTRGQSVEVRVLRADGVALWCELATTRSRSLQGEPYVMVQVLDVHGRKTQELALEAAAQRDPLTGLANRHALSLRLDTALTRAVGGQEPASLTLLFLDLDGFKDVNDRYGHDAGDAVLVEVAGRLRSVVRPGDLVVRLGGDEFVVLCTGLRPRDAEMLVSRIQHVVGLPVERDGQALSIGVSIGTARTEDPRQVPSLLETADRGMYQQKHQRRRLERQLLVPHQP